MITCVRIESCHPESNSSHYQVDEEDEELGQNSLSGLYPLGCILSHHCLANTVHTFESAEVPITKA